MDLFIFLIDSPIINALALTLLHFLWQGCVIALILYLALSVISKQQSELRYVISLAAMGFSITVPIATFLWLYQPVNLLSTSNLSPSLIERLQQQTEAATDSVLIWLDWHVLLSATSVLWIVGVLYLSIHLILELFTVYKLPKRDVIEPEQDVANIFARLVQHLQVNRFTKLLISLKAEVPMVIGFIKPVVLVPFSMASGLTAPQLEMLLAHELAHVKRHDYLINFLQTLASILLFFHPLIKWISLQIRIEREYCCDDIAVQTCGNAKAYAMALTDAESIRSQHIPQLAMSAIGGDLKGRVLRMIDHTDCANKYSRSWHSMLLASLVAISMALMLFSAHAGYQTRMAKVLQGEVSTQQDIIQNKTTDVEQAPVPREIDDVASKSSKQTPDVMQGNGSISAAKQVTLAHTSDNQLHVDQALTSSETKTPQSDPVVLESVEIEPTKWNLQIPNKDGLEIFADEAAKQVQAAQIELSPSQTVALQRKQSIVENDSVQSSAKQSQLVVDQQTIESTSPAPITNLRSESKTKAALISIVAPSLVKNARPDYPRSAIARRIEAEVKVSFVVNHKGRINNIEFARNVPGYFKRSIRKALRHWRFEPGTIDGKISEMTLTRVFSFKDPNSEVIDPISLRLTGSRIRKQI
jgi:TonB family protein